MASCTRGPRCPAPESESAGTGSPQRASPWAFWARCSIPLVLGPDESGSQDAVATNSVVSENSSGAPAPRISPTRAVVAGPVLLPGSEGSRMRRGGCRAPPRAAAPAHGPQDPAARGSGAALSHAEPSHPARCPSKSPGPDREDARCHCKVPHYQLLRMSFCNITRSHSGTPRDIFGDMFSLKL